MNPRGRSGLGETAVLSWEDEELDLSRLREKYEKEIVPAMMREFQYKSIMAVPRMEKVVLNMGLGEAIYNIKVLDKGVEELTRIAGQKAVITKARKSIAGFKLREGMPIGCMVTLRAFRMYDFLDKLFNVTLRGSGISEEYPRRFLTAAVIAPLALKSRSFFRKSNMTKWIKRKVSIFRSSRRPRKMKRPYFC